MDTAELPLIDRHEILVDAPTDSVWSALPTVLPIDTTVDSTSATVV